MDERIVDMRRGMTPQQALRQEAQWYANSMRALRTNDALDPEAVSMRASTYMPDWQWGTVRGFVCPHCWIGRQARVQLNPAPGTDDHDVLCCSDRIAGCDAEFIIPF